MNPTDDQLMTRWGKAALRTGTAIHCVYPEIAVLREFYLDAYSQGQRAAELNIIDEST